MYNGEGSATGERKKESVHCVRGEMGCDWGYGKLEAGVGIFSGLGTNISNFNLMLKSMAESRAFTQGEIGPHWGEATSPLGTKRREQGQ